MTTLSDAMTYVRRRCGSPDLTECPADLVQENLEVHGLGWLNRRKPNHTIAYFLTVASQQDYSVLPAGGYEIVNAWWMDTDFEYFSPGMRVMPLEQQLDFQLAGFNAFDHPSSVEDFYKKVQAYANNFKGKHIVLPDGTLRLVPYPGNSGDKVYFEYTSPLYANVPAVSAKDIEGLICYAAHLTFEYLSVKRGVVRGGKNFTGGGGEREETKAKEYLEKAEGEIPVAGVFFARG